MYLKYLRYVVLHKWFVFQAGLKLRVPIWQLIIHDLSKFRPDEFIPYAQYFYGPKLPSTKEVFGDERNHTRLQEEVEDAFNAAWLKHIHRNPHHWQYWLLKEDSGGSVTLSMPYNYVLEMVADWRGAGAYMGNADTPAWYAGAKYNMTLHPNTLHEVEHLLGLKTTEPCLVSVK
jgi:hypothetical protein